LKDGYCHADNVTLTAQIKGYVNVTSGSVDALKLAVAKHGPISVAIDASHRTFSFYSNGVYYDSQCGKKIKMTRNSIFLENTYKESKFI
jgi:Papain family cysteine protease